MWLGATRQRSRKREPLTASSIGRFLRNQGCCLICDRVMRSCGLATNIFDNRSCRQQNTLSSRVSRCAGRKTGMHQHTLGSTPTDHTRHTVNNCVAATTHDGDHSFANGSTTGVQHERSMTCIQPRRPAPGAAVAAADGVCFA